MPPETFTHTTPDLLPTLAELTAREPIFHRADFSTTMSLDYWEVGASGRRYSREFILGMFANDPPIDAAEAGWQAFDHQLRSLGSNTFLLTYTLRQGDRLSRRATLWQRTPLGWQILYHQGTLVTGQTGEDDTAPVPLPHRATVSS